nr:MFS transporter [Corynebacterium lactis]
MDARVGDESSEQYGARQYSLRSSRIAVSTAFGLHGMMLAAVLSSLPAIRADLGATDALLAMIIGIVSALAAVGSILSEKVAARRGSAGALTAGIGMQVIGGLLIISNWGLPSFLFAVAVYGLGIGGVDAGGNMQAVALQRRYGTVILASFFAAWSGGAIVGALIVSAGEALLSGNTALGAVELTSYRVNIGVAIAILLIVGLAASRWFLRGFQEPLAGTAGASGPAEFDPGVGAVSWRPVVLVGIAMSLFYAVDFGLSNWSPLLLHDALAASASTAALGVAVYQIAGFITRMFADRLVRRFGDVAVLRTMASIATFGMILTISAHSVLAALVGLGLVGLGVSVTAPMCFSAIAHEAHGTQLDVMVARLNLFNYGGTIVGGVVIGSVLAATSVRVSFFIPLLACAALVLMASAFAGTRRAVVG